MKFKLKPTLIYIKQLSHVYVVCWAVGWAIPQRQNTNKLTTSQSRSYTPQFIAFWYTYHSSSPHTQNLIHNIWWISNNDHFSADHISSPLKKEFLEKTKLSTLSIQLVTLSGVRLNVYYSIL